VTAACVIIMVTGGLAVCQLLGLFYGAVVWSGPDNVHASTYVPIVVLVTLLAGLIGFAAGAMLGTAWTRIGVRVLSFIGVALAVVTQRLGGDSIGPYAVAVLLLVVPNLLLATPSANAYFGRRA
jgi:hypothetical protein